jgi:hypothetical protein
MSEGQGWRKRNVNNESEQIIGNRFSSGAAGQNNGCMKVFACCLVSVILAIRYDVPYN